MPVNKPEQRVLVFAPTGQDAAAITGLLNESGFLAEIAAASYSNIWSSAGALLLTEEALESSHVANVLERLQSQPPWSELPVIILTSGGQTRRDSLLDLAASAAGSVTLLERPIRAATLIRSVEVALKSRARQYLVRDLLEEQERKRRELEEAQVHIQESELRYRTLFESIDEGFAVVEMIYDEPGRPVDYRFLEVNPAFERLTGIEGAIGRTVREFSPQHEEHWFQSYARVAKTGEPMRFQNFAAGFKRWFDVYAFPLGPAETRQVALLFTDITARLSKEQELRESEERYRLLVAQVKDYAIFRTDKVGRPTSWNVGVQRVLGFGEKEFLGQDIVPLIFTPEDLEARVPDAELRQAASEGTADNNRWMRRRDGTRFYASGVTTKLHNDAGEHVGYTKVFRDETARRRVEEALAKAQAELEAHAANLEKVVAERTRDLSATNEQLEAFVYSIAHDLRAPLRSMAGYSQLLVDDYAAGLEDFAQTLLKRIHASSMFMDQLLLDLLAYGRTTRAEMELKAVDLSQAWDAARFQCASQIEQTRGTVEVAEPLPRVIAHEATLGQCLANLLSNALKFVGPGVQPRIRSWAEQRDDYVRLWIEDNGIGIPANQHERVFRVFERMHGARYAGTGIGLSIVRKGVERMGGRVGLESEPGKGSRFWIELRKAS